ncbi:hypothetical protein [Zafaria cholistanensis]|uniref:hypothetical protein n=1 Tax=Zafaria cholistanensis TaxID=1682741 RepID=UPI00155AF5C5|nr:hypothetical protein [Zafaria cholistanensis]
MKQRTILPGQSSARVPGEAGVAPARPQGWEEMARPWSLVECRQAFSGLVQAEIPQDA